MIKKSKRPGKLLIFISILFILVLLLVLSAFFFLKNRFTSGNRSWDETTTVNLLTEKPTKNIYLTFDNSSDESGNGAKVITYVDLSVFLEKYQSHIEEEKESYKYTDQAVLNHINQIKKYADTRTEIDISQLEKYLKEQLNCKYEYTGPDVAEDGYAESWQKYFDQLDDCDEVSPSLFDKYQSTSMIQDLMDEGKAAIFDLENNHYVKYFVHKSKGFICGPLCGRGLEEYLLPSGKTFIYSSWIS